MLRNSFFRQKWLWIVISAATIISFVAFFSPQQRRGASWMGPDEQVGSIDGRPVTRQEYVDAYHESALRFFMNYGQWPDDQMTRQGMMENEVRNRLLLLERARQMGITVGEPALAAWIVEQFNMDGRGFRKEIYEQFIAQLATKRVSQADFERFARNEVAIQHLVALTGAAGKLITPQEAEAQFRRENEELEAEAVFLASSNFVSQVVVEPAAVATYFTNNLPNYRVPEKLQVAYVKFPAIDYLEEADRIITSDTNLNLNVDAIYNERGTNSFLDATNTPLPPEAAKEKIRDELRERVALHEARRKAIHFANELFEMDESVESLEKLAAAKGLVSEVTEPFSQFETPRNLNVPQNFNQIASRLTPEEPIAEQPIVGEDAVYMIGLKQRIPSSLPPLEAIEERVTRDYIDATALDMAHAAGRELQQTLAKRIADGESFQAAASEQGASPVMLPPFSKKAQFLPGIPNRADVSQLVNTAFALRPGTISEFIETRNGGFLVFAKDRVPVPDQRVAAELGEFTKELRQSRQFEAFADWFRNELATARIELPGDRQRTASAR
jgi:parvulin-like peptidyl-prolyl isomerase